MDFIIGAKARGKKLKGLTDKHLDEATPLGQQKIEIVKSVVERTEHLEAGSYPKKEYFYKSWGKSGEGIRRGNGPTHKPQR